MKREMKNLPERIWLNLGEDVPEGADFRELGEVTWSEEPVNDGDVEYVRGWRDVSKELPEDGQKVLFCYQKYYQGRYLQLCNVDRYSEAEGFMDGVVEMKDVLCWMPVPEMI